MGLFDKLVGKKETVLTPKAALALACMTVVAADGGVDEEEMATLKRIVKDDQQAFHTAIKVYKDLSTQECVDLVVASLNPKQRVAVLVNLLDIAMADGVFAGPEEKLLVAYLEALQISEQVVKDLVEMIALKNDHSIFEE